MQSFFNTYEMRSCASVSYPSWIKSERYFNCENFYQTFILGKLHKKIKKSR